MQPLLLSNACRYRTSNSRASNKSARGQPPIFNLALRGTGFAGAGVPATFAPQFDPPITISRDDWFKVLTGLGFGTRRIIELPPALRGRR